MLLQLHYLRKQFYTSPARRKACEFYNQLNFQSKIRQLSLHKRWNAGRGASGQIIARSKGALLIKQKYIKINYNLRYLKLGFIASFKFIPFKNRLLSLIYFSNGALTYYLTSELHSLFAFLYLNRYRKLRKVKLKNSYLMLLQIKKLSFVSCAELLPNSGAQYIRSPGTKAKILRFEKETHSTMLQLPSGVKKVFSFYSFVLLGQLAMSMHSRCTNTKSGYWRSFGVKPIVRGVAMNAVDHPHGGRTKAIRYQRTPWGHTTKFK